MFWKVQKPEFSHPLCTYMITCFSIARFIDVRFPSPPPYFKYYPMFYLNFRNSVFTCLDFFGTLNFYKKNIHLSISQTKKSRLRNNFFLLLRVSIELCFYKLRFRRCGFSFFVTRFIGGIFRGGFCRWSTLVASKFRIRIIVSGATRGCGFFGCAFSRRSSICGGWGGCRVSWFWHISTSYEEVDASLDNVLYSLAKLVSYLWYENVSF